VTATAVSGTEIDLSWSASAGATGYAIVVKADDASGGGSDPCASLPASQTTYDATGLDPNGASYSFTVVAFNPAGASAISGVEGVQTQAVGPAPAQVRRVLVGGILNTWGDFDFDWSLQVQNAYPFPLAFVQRLTVTLKGVEDIGPARVHYAVPTQTLSYFEYLHNDKDPGPLARWDQWAAGEAAQAAFYRSYSPYSMYAGEHSFTGECVWTGDVRVYKLSDVQTKVSTWRPLGPTDLKFHVGNRAIRMSSGNYGANVSYAWASFNATPLATEIYSVTLKWDADGQVTVVSASGTIY
jgi:hypothetical protein